MYVWGKVLQLVVYKCIYLEQALFLRAGDPRFDNVTPVGEPIFKNCLLMQIFIVFGLLVWYK